MKGAPPHLHSGDGEGCSRVLQCRVAALAGLAEGAEPNDKALSSCTAIRWRPCGTDDPACLTAVSAAHATCLPSSFPLRGRRTAGGVGDVRRCRGGVHRGHFPLRLFTSKVASGVRCACQWDICYMSLLSLKSAPQWPFGKVHCAALESEGKPQMARTSPMPSKTGCRAGGHFPVGSRSPDF